MSVRVDLSRCIGCGVCAQFCPDVFKVEENEGKCLVISQNEPKKLKTAIDSCPVSAIIHN